MQFDSLPTRISRKRRPAMAAFVRFGPLSATFRPGLSPDNRLGAPAKTGQPSEALSGTTPGLPVLQAPRSQLAVCPSHVAGRGGVRTRPAGQAP